MLAIVLVAACENTNLPPPPTATRALGVAVVDTGAVMVVEAEEAANVAIDEAAAASIEAATRESAPAKVRHAVRE